MKYIIYLLFFQTILFSQVKSIYAPVEKQMRLIPEQQTKSVQEIASYIQANFKGEELQIKAAYFYVISSISYDVTYNFSTELFSSDEDFVTKTIATNKGVCIHYAKLFKAIVDKLGYQCQIVTGYTKQNNQISNLSHAWCAIKMQDKNWYIFDPTWDSGYVKNEKFVRNLVSKHFKMLPSAAIISHMPFDYLWQFTKEPISNREFYNGKLYDGKPKINFEYQIEIDKYLKLSEIDKAFESSERIQKNEILNDLILEEYNYKKNIFNTTRLNKNVEKFNEIVEEYNIAIVLLNDFIIYRNKEFTPSYADAILLEMIKTPKERLENVQKEFFVLGSIGKENASSYNSLRASISDTVKQAQEQYEFVKEYISKSKKERKKMFRTVTWFGIPVK
ncbi:transglutaminase domain-containing protein [Flavobacterium sp. N2820]|jgi:hypothetical protein|uniref:transglutaminase domain-containing protein n=1 Tax=Flavobacterium sp. N2820 TaxID=2986834 RepID=UPI002225AE41|nr:transglutaminase domain-containing protein [Flavobacterium sp. N2820]